MVAILKKVFVPDFIEELKQILILAWPLTFMNLFRFLNPTISVIMCGHLSKIEFNAASLANAIINVFGVSVDLGFSTSCDTLFAQVYGGRNRHKLGVMLQRAILVMTLLYFLLASVHLNIEPILIALQQDVLISRLTARYVALYLPGLFFDFYFLTISRYLQNQNIVYPMMISSIIGTIFNATSQYIALYVLGYGMDASAILQATGCFLMFFIQLTYILVTKSYKSTWQGIEFYNALESWGIFFKLGIPGIIMISIEEWCYEIANFLAGYLSATQLGAQSIAFQTAYFTFQFHVGLSIAAAIRCGQFLGARKPKQAFITTKVVILSDFIVSIIATIFILSLHVYIPYIFTTDGEIVQLARNLLIILSGFQIFDGVCSSTAGILRACGRQLKGAVVMVMCNYFISLPIGFILIFAANFNITGFWYGMYGGYSIEIIIYMIILYRINWDEEVDRAIENEKISKLDRNNENENGICEDESKPFVSDNSKSENSSTLNYHHQFNGSHRRNLSGATDLVKKWVHTDDNDLYKSTRKSHDKLISKRLLFVIITLLIFISSVIIKINLPPSLYIPCIPVGPNVTSTLSRDKHYPFCNDTMYL